MGEQRREEAQAVPVWGRARHLGYVVVFADEPGGDINGIACATIMNFREAHLKLRELRAKGYKSRLRVAIVRGLAR